MKHDSPIDESSRFRGGIRHYHRKGAQPQSSWEQWVEGEAKIRPKQPWGLIILGVLGLLALAGIAVALFIELS